MVDVTETLFLRYMQYDGETAHHELVPGAEAGALQASNSFVPGTPNSGIDAVWGRAAELLSNAPVSPKFRNCGFKRADTGAVIKLVPVNTMFVRPQGLPRAELVGHLPTGAWRLCPHLHRQQAVGREELDAAPAIKIETVGRSIYMVLFRNWTKEDPNTAR